MKEIHLKYKSETGNKPFDNHEIDFMVEPYDHELMSMNFDTKKDLINALRYDSSHNLRECLLLEDTNLYVNSSGNNEVTVYRSEYVEWLEEKLIELLNK